MNTIRITAAALFVLFSFGAVAVSAQHLRMGNLPPAVADADAMGLARVV